MYYYTLQIVASQLESDPSHWHVCHSRTVSLNCTHTLRFSASSEISHFRLSIRDPGWIVLVATGPVGQLFFFCQGSALRISDMRADIMMSRPLDSKYVGLIPY